ncbi:hypothetical protein EIN_059740 [Entamoeba invadens IP1]|uniref:hypothetical protein n=1 Tax=Entamoeba invadens IP1 TaxID=370355 RepID=UPI0002C3D94E|nr:hypothetical protein EIN_059740 [Entamoeba invadens IP1]ELP93479.1 hypothetical protein EIN_059740 [Entamoeba invadens IP1]|eukprot:XP_004260250.1 hypothetical protein EIN_059740 [Entamoeba invadens IP1]
MSKGTHNIPLSQLLTQSQSQSQSQNTNRLASIRGVQQPTTKLQFAPNTNATKPEESQTKKDEKTHLRVKREQQIKKTVIPQTQRVFKPRPATHGEGGLGFSGKSSSTATQNLVLDKVGKKEKKTLQLNPELDFDPCNPNHPISLPLKNPEDKVVEEAKKEDTTAIKKTYYTPLETLEENPKILNFPLHTESGLLYDEYVMMQIPSVLPLKSTQMEEEKIDEKINQKIDQQNKDDKKSVPKEEEKAEDKIHEEPKDIVQNPLNGMCGYIGTIQYRKSGIATMKIGGVTYRLTKGAKPHFLEEACVVSQAKKEVYRLGSISQHVVMVPDLEQCLD